MNIRLSTLLLIIPAIALAAGWYADRKRLGTAIESLQTERFQLKGKLAERDLSLWTAIETLTSASTTVSILNAIDSDQLWYGGTNFPVDSNSEVKVAVVEEVAKLWLTRNEIFCAVNSYDKTIAPNDRLNIKQLQAMARDLLEIIHCDSNKKFTEIFEGAESSSPNISSIGQDAQEFALFGKFLSDALSNTN